MIPAKPITHRGTEPESAEDLDSPESPGGIASRERNPEIPSDARVTVSSGLLHDLRSPLNLIIGYSEILSETAEDNGLGQFIQDLEKIGTAGRKLTELINSSFQTVSHFDDQNATARSSATHIDQHMTRSEAQYTAITPDPANLCAPLEFILVVDDNEFNRDVLARRLVRQGYQVVMVPNGREALAIMHTHAFDLVLLDIMMPEMDGYQVLSELKADESLRNIPVIMISALSELDSVVRCIELGADDYLAKPFEPTLLKARVKSSLERKRAHDREKYLYNQLHENYARLQQLEKQRDDLTRMIVHDLRTPLSSIIAGLHTIDVVGELNDDQREMVDIAMSGGETLLGMINTLLDVEKLESGSMHLDYTAVSPTHLVTTAIGQISSLAAEKQLNIVPIVQPDLSPIHCDNNKIIRTMVNLIGNAIKFTPFGGTVTIGIRHDEDNTHALISVTDTGEGIPPDAFELIFQKFGQVASRKGGRTMSTGLGLTFCKLAVEAHGGKIWVESTPGHGSTFTFNIPNSKQ